MTSSVLEGAQTLELDAPRIESALRELWREASASGDGPPVARVRALNLIVYTEDDASANFADAVMDILPEQHPCRAIIVRRDADDSAPLRASISARCQITPGGARKVCSELINVSGGAGLRDRLADALSSLLVADLPVTLWWTGRPRPADPLFRRFGRGLADRVLIDSAAFRDSAAGLIALSRRHDDPRYRASLADVAWERLRPWRQLLAQTVDPAAARRGLDAITEVAIGYAGDGAPPEESLLLAGWLAAALRWRPEDSPATGVVTLRSPSRLVRLRFVPAAADAGGGDAGSLPLRFVRLASANGHAFGLRAGDQPEGGVLTSALPGAAAIEHQVALPRTEPGQLVATALGRAGADPVYEAALMAAAEIATLGATA